MSGEPSLQHYRLRRVGFDLLVVCRFAFDAHAGETAKEFAPSDPASKKKGIVAEGEKQFGKLPVLLARMNPDLSMGEELLKKTGTGNLFMVFGEPDVRIDRAPDGKIVVEIKGVDVYDPGPDPFQRDRRHRLLVHRHQLQP